MHDDMYEVSNIVHVYYLEFERDHRFCLKYKMLEITKGIKIYTVQSKTNIIWEKRERGEEKNGDEHSIYTILSGELV